MNRNAIETKADQINAALLSKGYKQEEAKAVVWEKEVRPGQTIRRIYLKGKKANGFVHQVGEQWMVQDIAFQLLRQIVSEVL